MLLNPGNGLSRSSYVLLRAGSLIASLLLGLASSQADSASASIAVAEHRVSADPDAVAERWDRGDLLSARPAEMPTPPEAVFDVPEFPDASTSAALGPFTPKDASALPERLHGKVFFNVGAVRYQCSGTLVSSLNGNIVYTAGHCVYNEETKNWVTNFVFIPGYENGLSQFATYPATLLSAPKSFTNNGNLSYDIGMATLSDNPEADVGGARQIVFNLDPLQRRYTLYGYPALPNPPYDGQALAGCRARVALRDGTSPRTMGVTPCDMKQGASGGGWITDGNYLNSVTSYTYCDTDTVLCGFIWGPHFSNAAMALYTSPAGGGSVKPTLKVKFAPPKIVRKRKVLFKFSGTGSTPVKFECHLDRKRFSRCGARKTISNLSLGRHVLRVRSVDQTGRKSRSAVAGRFRVILKRR